MLNSGLARRVFMFTLVGACLLLRPSISHATPTVSAAVNNASFINAGLPNGKLAPGVLAAIFGQAMGPSSIVRVPSFPLPTILGGTSVRITVGGTSVDCYMIYTIATQLAV